MTDSRIIQTDATTSSLSDVYVASFPVPADESVIFSAWFGRNTTGTATLSIKNAAGTVLASTTSTSALALVTLAEIASDPADRVLDVFIRISDAGGDAVLNWVESEIQSLGGGGSLDGPAGGDLSGTYPDPTVDSVEGVDVSSSPPEPGQVLVATGPTTAEWRTLSPQQVIGSSGRRQRGRMRGLTFGGRTYIQKVLEESIGYVFEFAADLGNEIIQSATVSGASASITSIDNTRAYVMVTGNGAVEVIASTSSGKKYSRTVVFRDQATENTRDYRDL